MKNKKTIPAPVGAKFYLAYGSNMNLPQMKRRCPNAQKMFPVTLPGYRLVFRGRQRDGWGVATIIPDEGCEVKGLLWAITSYCEEALDVYEGYPRLYTKETVTVDTPSGNQINAMAYIMDPQYKAATPSTTYFRSIMDGYAANGLNVQPLFDSIVHLDRELHPRKKKKKKEAAESKLQDLPIERYPEQTDNQDQAANE